MMQMKLLLIIALILPFLSCKQTDNSNLKFKIHSDGDFLDVGEHLIMNVHPTREVARKSTSFFKRLVDKPDYETVNSWYQPDKGDAGWFFAYGFDRSCVGPRARGVWVGQRLWLPRPEEIQQLISWAMRTWLRPIKDATNEKIVDNFYYERFPTVRRSVEEKKAIQVSEKRDVSRLVFPSTVDNNKFHWRFIFYCAVRVGLLSHVNGQAEAHILLWLPFAENKQDAKFTTLHEVGHAFGLSDTYSHSGGEMGGQPMSVMSSTLFHDKEGELILGRDDAVGIIDLYQRRHGKDRVLPEDYKDGYFGLPSYQAVFEVSQAYYHYIYHGNTNLIADLKDAFKQQYVFSRQGLNEIDNKGYAVLHYFINFGHLLLKRQAPEEVLKGWLEGFKSVLNESITNVNIQTEPEGNTPLHLATMHGYIPALKVLLAHKGIDKSIVNARGKTALDYATEKGLQEIIVLLQNTP